MGRKSKKRTLQEEQGAATRATKRTEVDDVSKSSAFGKVLAGFVKYFFLRFSVSRY